MRLIHRFIVTALSLSLALLLITPIASAQNSFDLHVDAMNSSISIEEDGVVNITEEVKVTFLEEFHGIYRYIPYIYSTSDQELYTEITVHQVLRNGADERFKEDRENGNVELKIGNPDQTISGTHTYTISYTAKGILRSFDGYDEFYWNVTGEDWEMPINEVQATVTLPKPGILKTACYAGNSGSNDSCLINTISDSEVQFTFDNALQPGQGVTIAVGYTEGLVPILQVEKPKTEIEQVVEQFQHPLILIVTAISVLTALILPWWLWFRYGRDWWWKQPEILEEASQTAFLTPWRHKPQVVVEFKPPLDLRPAQVGMLIDQKADTLDVTSTLIDLASRGYLTITELDKTWLLSSRDYQLDRSSKQSNALLEYEKILLDKIFGKKKSVKISDLKNTFYSDLEKVKDSIRKDLMDRGYFVKNPRSIRATYLAIGSIGLTLGISGIIIGIVFIQAWLVAISPFFLIGGIGLMVVSGAMPQRTAKGYEAYRRVLGYELFISTAETYRQRFFEDKNIFTEVLPYAIVFGLTDKFAKAMESIGYQPSEPTWYHGLHGFALMNFSQDVSNMSKSFTTTMASSPSSSGSGGGGSVGGGFGGGGGGGW